MTSENIYQVLPDFARQTHMRAQQYQEMYDDSLNDPENFWRKQGEKFITWFKPFEKTLQGNFKDLNVEWFVKGQLNACFNCVDRHLPTRANQSAIIWEGNSPDESLQLTYSQLHDKICHFANVLKKHGVKKGDRVAIYLPMIPEVVIAMLACARIGAIHTVIFAGFSKEAIKSRIQDVDCRVVITANEGLRAQKLIPLKENIDAALADCPGVKTVLVVKRTNNPVAWDPARDHWYHDEMLTVSADCPCEPMDAQDPLFILYTSGSTGKPKGILHVTGGYLVYAAMTHYYVFDYHPDQVYWCTADAGWITGHSYIVYGPLANGAITLLYEGVPNYPTPSRYWEIVDKYHVNIFYTSPTAIRALRHEGDKWVKQTSRKSLQLLGTVGEPINPDVWEWYFDEVGDSRCPIVDTWWQTETGGILISALPGATPLKPGSATHPFFGIKPDVLDNEGQSLGANQMGKLVISQPWPGMMKTIYGNPERFYNAYFKEFPGHYLTGDQALCDEEGYYWILGRLDDVLKVSGHRISTAEVENAFLLDLNVSEAAVVPVPHEIKGEAIYAFITLKVGVKESEELKADLIQVVRNAIGALAAPDTIQWAPALPKTRSGKIMRRLLRKIASHDIADLGDLTTLADPQVIENLVKGSNKT